MDARKCANNKLRYYSVSALCVLLLIERAGGLQITDLKVPQLVKNSSGRPVVLDCEYTLAQNEEGEGLVVKWFFNSQPAPVYQWIPGKKPQDLGILKGRLNLEYQASSHPSQAHRALQIISATSELSGEYKCSVSTFNDEDFMVKRMLIFAPEKRFEVWQSRGPREGLVNISCLATGAFPEPKLSLYPDSGTLEDVKIETRSQKGSYDVLASTVIEYPLEPTVFHCELRIPEAQYEIKKNFVYYPESGSRSLSRVSSASVAMLSAVSTAIVSSRWC
ncbi:uncharacterized protein LOC135935697 isoform X2 [Cloeon dipterum]|uniref:uncharacterized protein LOC135935697 isoform X2 n=1 Tax=Cloeon dipterum TaxID=197152 RepID=UPI0032202263